MKTIDFIRYELYNYFRNLWIFRKALWNYRRWDYSGMLEFMELASRDMSDCHEKHSHLMRGEQTAKELKVFAEYMKRIREDEYSMRYIKVDWELNRKPMIQVSPVKYEGPKYGSKLYREIERDWLRNDLQQAAKLFERKVKTWWE